MSRVLSRLDATHGRLLAEINSISEDQFSRQPADGDWSIAEIIHHLNLVEQRVTKELVQALERGPRRVNLLKRLTPTSNVSLRLIKVKAPNAVVPRSSQAKEETIRTFEDSRTRLKALYLEHGEDRLRNTVFRHPFLGEISGVAAFSFVAYHEKRHHKQIREVLKRLALAHKL